MLRSIFLLVVLFMSAGSARCIGIDDPVSLLGLDLKSAMAAFGVPEEVYTVRGEAAWQDDVVFRYKESFHLFWFRNRVWQVRLDRMYPGVLRDLGIGADRQTVLLTLGKPFAEEGDWVLYHYAGNGHPVRVRIFFDQRGIEDVYIYRADF
jgi:hypothetical protein